MRFLVRCSLNNLNIKTIHDLETRLDNLDKENITQPEIDSCVNKLGNIFLSTAKETFSTRYTVVKKKKKNVCISRDVGDAWRCT